MRATHYVAGGLRAAAGGCARIGRQARRAPLYAAAQAYAHLHPDGAVACVVALPDGHHWLVAAQDGAVLSRADRLYASAEAASLALRELCELRPALRVLDGADVLARLQQALDPAARLLAVDTRWEGLPWPVRAFVLGLAGVLALPPLWHHIAASRDAGRPAAAIDADAIWRDAVHAWRSGLRVHTPAELHRVVRSLYGIPLAVKGWRLQRAQCVPDAAAWRCSAYFERVLPQATHDDLVGAAPAGWHAQFEALGLSAWHWRVPGAGMSLASQPMRQHLPRTFISDLQRVALAFTDVQLGPLAPLAPPAPRDAGGVPLPPPEGPGILPPLRSRTLSLTGPLRSFGVLALEGVATSWSSLSLRLEPGRPAALAASVVAAQLQGTIYEQH
ncbi:type IV pilus assembly protein [Bordetella ansorpii]|uniref:Type IV pilus assembly protein n=1 Tax=Bordetella ansorpii TaxID=288768 RepID=A0A157SP86_9BORD|nr:type 4b pilus protein PilO2 [Bordetella ansorpii]SAI72111.1 type IV pilus assembly protein [Bordetella ansorpii]